MPIPKDTNPAEYDFTESDLDTGMTYTHNQLCYIRHQLFLEQQRKINSIVDMSNQLQYLMEQAECTGAITALTNLLNGHQDRLDLVKSRNSTSEE